ncbi:hypothetical protein N1F78_13390 [Seonamhaeicola sp. MEBiC1930]|uniref:hypothetical protein n=1 Tax=Seonamhaeicola sp. MEBiC01930 TaxID=2976768 RepID=UPI0032477820
MYKKFLNRLPIFLIIAFIVVCSCDGRKSKNDFLQDSITKFKDTTEPIEVIKYTPKQYTEIKTDTILSNGFTVKIKSYTDMNNSVLQTIKTSSSVVKLNFRKVISEVVAYKNDELIFKKELNTAFFLENLPDIDNTLEYINNEVYIDEEQSLKTNKLVLITSRCLPRTHNCPDYSIIIDEKGNYKVKEIDNNART